MIWMVRGTPGLALREAALVHAEAAAAVHS